VRELGGFFGAMSVPDEPFECLAPRLGIQFLYVAGSDVENDQLLEKALRKTSFLEAGIVTRPRAYAQDCTRLS
jgi:hypothetical protein